MYIPLVDLKAQYESIKAEIDSAIDSVIRDCSFIGGEELRRFEAEFAAYCEVKACVGVANGTDAIYLTLRAMEIGSGDEVITVSHTFVATAEAISASGAIPVFVDVKKDTLLLDPDLLEAAITPKTRAVIPVHLYGQPCEMDSILHVAKKYGLIVIEDAAQAHGARWAGRRVGSFGDAACFSFYPGKNLGAYGDAGAVVSHDEDLIYRVRMLANHGRFEKYTHEMIGVNSRLDALQAAILRVKLRYLDEWNESRRRHAAQYLNGLEGSGATLPDVRRDADPVWHLFVLRLSNRNSIQHKLREAGIQTGVHYPIPVHLQPAYRDLGVMRGCLAVTEQATEQVLSLPMYPELTQLHISRIVDELIQG
jgi:dTDP-4-amino-4,6-dideoxygalactose transaminase